MSYSSQSVIGISFEYCAEFAGSDGFIKEWKVFNHFNLSSRRKTIGRLGFQDSSFFMKHRPNITISSKILDHAWAELLENPPPEWRGMYRHSTEINS
jgi:hypothetical protein